MTRLRRRYVLASLTVCALLLASPSHTATPWYSTAIPDEDTDLKVRIGGVEQTLYERSYALVIGEVNYAHWDHLLAVPNETAALVKALERQHFKVDLYYDLTSEEMTNVIDTFMRNRATVANSRIVVYVSGHGFTRNLAKPLGYLVGVDAPGPDSAEPSIEQKSVSLPMFAAWAQTPDAQHMLFIFDACFSGSFFGYLPSDNSGLTPGAMPGEIKIPVQMGKDGAIKYQVRLDPGIESVNYVESPEARQKGRQFLVAGDDTDTTPTNSIMTRLLVDILDDRNTAVQSNLDVWTSGEEIGRWLHLNGANYQTVLAHDSTPATPMFAPLPGDIYQKGDIVFARLDRPELPTIDTHNDVWSSILKADIPVTGVLAGAALHPQTVAQTAVPSAEILAKASSLLTQTDKLATSALTPDNAKLDPAETLNLEALLEKLPSSDQPIRHQARRDLAKFVAGLTPPKQAATIDLLYGNLAKKSYRFQLGVTEAISMQTAPVHLKSSSTAQREIQSALLAPAGQDPDLRRDLQAAAKTLSLATNSE